MYYIKFYKIFVWTFFVCSIYQKIIYFDNKLREICINHTDENLKNNFASKINLCLN